MNLLYFCINWFIFSTDSILLRLKTIFWNNSGFIWFEEKSKLKKGFLVKKVFAFCEDIYYAVHFFSPCLCTPLFLIQLRCWVEFQDLVSRWPPALCLLSRRSGGVSGHPDKKWTPLLFVWPTGTVISLCYIVVLTISQNNVPKQGKKCVNVCVYSWMIKCKALWGPGRLDKVQYTVSTSHLPFKNFFPYFHMCCKCPIIFLNTQDNTYILDIFSLKCIKIWIFI